MEPTDVITNPERLFIEGQEQLPNWTPRQIEGPAKVLILPDIHLPYHHNLSLGTAVGFGRQNDVDHVLINGDLFDFYHLSRFQRDPRMRRPKAELELGRKFFEYLRNAFSTARILFKFGNHDERWHNYILDKAPVLSDIPELEFENLLGLDKLNIEVVKDKRPVRLGSLNVVHGHEYTFNISNPVNPARGLYNRAYAYALCGHFHQKSEHSENNIEGKSITTWSTGCLCGLRPAWLPFNKWCHGFAFVEVYSSGKFSVSNHKISDGKIY
jgi:predicted phosphodiesterase